MTEGHTGDTETPERTKSQEKDTQRVTRSESESCLSVIVHMVLAQYVSEDWSYTLVTVDDNVIQQKQTTTNQMVLKF